MTEHAFSLFKLHLFQKCPFRIQTSHDLFCVAIPENCPMLHSRPRYTPDFRKNQPLFLQTRKHEVNCFEPHRYWREYLAFGRVREDSFLDAIPSKVCVKVDLGFVDKFEVGLNYNSYILLSVTIVRWGQCSVVGHIAVESVSTFQLLGAQVKSHIQSFSHGHTVQRKLNSHQK